MTRNRPHTYRFEHANGNVWEAHPNPDRPFEWGVTCHYPDGGRWTDLPQGMTEAMAVAAASHSAASAPVDEDAGHPGI